MHPNDELADLQHAKAIEAMKLLDFQNMAWHETAAAHLTTSKRPATRGKRAVQSCIWWRAAGHDDWARDMARAFLNDACIPRRMKLALVQIARGQEPAEPLGISIVGPGSGFFNVLYWGAVAGSLWGAYKLARYLVTGSFGPSYPSSRIPPAWEVHG